MSIFKRRISTAGLKALHAMANDAGENWWKDLLSLWRPSGQPCGKDGLRLAIRDSYLNFLLPWTVDRQSVLRPR